MLSSLLFVFVWQTPSPAASVDRYIVTVRPIDVGVGAGLCIAVDPTNPHGVWWWEPGRTGCTSRSTGPDVFPAESARVVAASPAGRLNVSFRLPTHSSTRPFVDVRLIVEDGMMRNTTSAAAVPVVRRKDLKIPDASGRLTVTR